MRCTDDGFAREASALQEAVADYFGGLYHDVITLQKLEGAWRIVGKVFTHVPD